jgi:hypothetical protein
MDMRSSYPPPPRRSAALAPLRAPGSVRRTSSIDVSWPDGRGGDMRLSARARDIVTPFGGGRPHILAEDAYTAILRPDRAIAAIESDPLHPALATLVGERAGGGLRKALREAVPEELERGSPLYLILDDMAGASLVAGWVWSQWDPNWGANLEAMRGDPQMAKAMMPRLGVCVSFFPGSSALGARAHQLATAAEDPRRDDDPDGWHAFDERPGPGLRRARRIDVRLNKAIEIDAAFQDSGGTPDGGRAVVHEYSLSVTADPATLKVLAIEATPHVLPHRECQAAPPNLDRLLGATLPELRDRVLVELRGEAGCTHLNDAVRALADAPMLVAQLRETV